MSSIPKSSNSLLEVVDLQTWIKTRSEVVRSVNGINFSIEPGQILSLIGESGSGKSITARSIIRLLPFHAVHGLNSQIYLEDQDLLLLPEKKLKLIRGRQISMIFQDPQTSLNPVISIGAQLAESVRLHQGLLGRALWRSVEALLDKVQMPQSKQQIKRFPHELSGGMKQRVMIAMAIAGNSKLLIADEPTTALDVSTQTEILNLLKQLQRENHMAMLFITHDLGLAKQISDKICVMHQGKILESAKTRIFFKSPKDPYSKMLLEKTPVLSKKLKPKPAHHTVAPLIEVEDLSVTFPVKSKWLRRKIGEIEAVAGIDFTLFEGETLALVGESGSGKTTTARALVGLQTKTSGEITFIGSHKPKMVFQDPFASLDPKMRIMDSLMEGMCANHIGDTRSQREEKIQRVLEQVGLELDHLWRYPHAFSGGQRQRICIARVLLLDPKIIVFDEPTSSLDVCVQTEIMALLKTLQAKRALSYLFITHNLALVQQIADRVAVMYQGQIVEQGAVDQVIASPQHEYTKHLIACSVSGNRTYNS